MANNPISALPRLASAILMTLGILMVGNGPVLIAQPGLKSDDGPAPAGRQIRLPDEIQLWVTAPATPLGVRQGGSVAVPDLFIASSANDWNPAGQKSRSGSVMTMRSYTGVGRQRRETVSTEVLWMFTLSGAEAMAPGFEFKFTRGDWSTVEVAADGSDIANRRLADIDLDTLEWSDRNGRSSVMLELKIEGFADKRAGNAANMAPERTTPTSKARVSTVVGTLELHELPTPTLTTPTRTIRVWLPEGYHDPANADRRYPVLYMHDGQNLFDAATSAFGSEWRVDETMTALIAERAIEPWIVVGIDHAGENRVGELSPDGVAVRGQTGSGSRYVAFVVDELVPWVEREFRAIPEPSRRALGGSSCGGNITVQTVIERPGVFSRALIESPALWIGDELLIDRAKRFEGPMPDRTFIGMGDAEYGDADRDAALVEMARSLREAMMRPMQTDGHRSMESAALQFVALQIAEGAKHNEDAWARRLPGALTALLREHTASE